MYLAFSLNQLGNNDKNYFNHLYTHTIHIIHCTWHTIYLLIYYTVIIFKSIAHANIASLLVYKCANFMAHKYYFANKFITPQHLGTYTLYIGDIFNIAVICHLSLTFVGDYLHIVWFILS